jgi:HlyD family secretion protein
MRILATASLIFVLVLVPLAVAGGFASYGGRSGESYITVPVSRGSGGPTVKATGIVNPVIMVDVGSELSGQISDVLVNFNDIVKVGQVMARVNPETYIAAVNEAKAVLKIAKATAMQQTAALQSARVAAENARTARNVAEAELAAAQVKQDEAERDFQRDLQLSKVKSIADREFTRSRATRDAGAATLRSLMAQMKMKDASIEIADAELSMAEANLQSTQAVVEQKQASLEQAELNLQRTQIRAPIDGIVIKRAINPGQTVAVSLESKTLFKLANDLREMEVDGKIDEADVGQVKAGQPATFTVDAYPEKKFSGRVVQVRKAPEVSQSVVTYTTVVSAPNPDYLLFPGMTARLRIIVEETKDVLKIPNAALRFRPKGEMSGSGQSTGLGPGSATVWVARKSGGVFPTAVTVGKSDGSVTQLHSGPLNEGDRVIVGATATAERSIFLRVWRYLHD